MADTPVGVMGCGGRVAGSLLSLIVALALAAAPVLGQQPTVYRWPAAPAETPTEPGSVTVIVMVRGETGWATVDGAIIVPPGHVLPTECSMLPLEGTG